VDEVVDYYRDLFNGAGLPFHPRSNALAATIFGDAPECDLIILIRKSAAGAGVQITCSNKAHTAAREKAEKRGLEGQARFDEPVYPKPRIALPPLVWPDWLTSCDPAATPEVQAGVDRFKLKFLKAEFTTRQDRDAIQDFYADLLNAHGYPVWVESSRLTPSDHSAVLEGVHYFDAEPRTAVLDSCGIDARGQRHPRGVAYHCASPVGAVHRR
jgi:hypothetical protein